MFEAFLRPLSSPTVVLIPIRTAYRARRSLLVIGGNDNEIAQCIYENQPAGIQSYGNTSVNITDSHGIEAANQL